MLLLQLLVALKVIFCTETVFPSASYVLLRRFSTI